MTSQRNKALVWLFAVALTAITLLGKRADKPSDEGQQSTAIALMREQTNDGFATAIAAQTLRFPDDHGPHPDFRTEWWYFTGHLRAQDNREFGFQLTLFRFELAKSVSSSSSSWRTPRALLGHFAITDLAANKFHAFERIARASANIAGATNSPPAIWLDDWRLDYRDGSWLLHASQLDTALSLSLEPRSAIVAQGDGGLSRKSAQPGNASYYYSIPHLSAQGQLTIGEERLEVTGDSWLDREWSTSALAAEQDGWDWFSLQLGNGASLMFYQLRRADGSIDAHSAGSYVDDSGTLHRLNADDVQISVHKLWTSPATNITYPAAWEIDVPKLAVHLDITPKLAEQEWQQRFRYWEGAVEVDGSHRNEPINGQGYVELTGYAAR